MNPSISKQTNISTFYFYAGPSWRSLRWRSCASSLSSSSSWPSCAACTSAYSGNIETSVFPQKKSFKKYIFLKKRCVCPGCCKTCCCWCCRRKRRDSDQYTQVKNAQFRYKIVFLIFKKNDFSPGAAAQGEKDWRDMEDKLQQRERKSVKK